MHILIDREAGRTLRIVPIGRKTMRGKATFRMCMEAGRKPQIWRLGQKRRQRAVGGGRAHQQVGVGRASASEQSPSGRSACQAWIGIEQGPQLFGQPSLISSSCQRSPYAVCSDAATA